MFVQQSIATIFLSRASFTLIEQKYALKTPMNVFLVIICDNPSGIPWTCEVAVALETVLYMLAHV